MMGTPLEISATFGLLTPSDGSPLLQQVEQAEADAIRALMPPPHAVQYWLDGGSFYHPDRTTTRDDYAAAAVKWLVKAVAHAHLSPTLIKPAGRALLAQRSFTNNLGNFNAYSIDGNHTYLGAVWGHILMPKLDAKLTALGEEARTFNVHANVATELGSAAVAACSTRHLSYPPGSRARQDQAMPAVAAQFDFVGGWKDQPEQVYIHTLCLTALALDALFAAELGIITSDIPGTELHAAQTKSYGRMAGKMVASDDHRYDQKPRPAMNIDIVRRLAVTPRHGCGPGVDCGRLDPVWWLVELEVFNRLGSSHRSSCCRGSVPHAPRHADRRVCTSRVDGG
jgi:hypothetical protein